MEDKKEELIKKIKEYEKNYDEQMRKIAFFLGRMQQRFNNPVGRFILAKITTKLIAYLIVKFKLFGIERKENSTLIGIALNWLKPSLFLKIPYEIDEVTSDKIVILRPECTVGFKDPKLSKLCRASMNMDMEIIRRLGGKLTVTETILEGAKYCRHIIEKK